MTRRDAITAACAAAVLLLTGCGGDDDGGDSAGGTPSASSSAAVELAQPFTATDEQACGVVADRGPAYDYLTGGDATGLTDAVMGHVEVGIYAGQADSPELNQALQAVVDSGTTYARAFNGGQDSPDPAELVAALEGAAAVCDAGGVPIAWA